MKRWQNKKDKAGITQHRFQPWKHYLCEDRWHQYWSMLKLQRYFTGFFKSSKSNISPLFSPYKGWTLQAMRSLVVSMSEMVQPHLKLRDGFKPDQLRDIIPELLKNDSWQFTSGNIASAAWHLFLRLQGDILNFHAPIWFQRVGHFMVELCLNHRS